MTGVRAAVRAALGDPDPSDGAIRDHLDADHPDLLDRWLPVVAWVEARRAAGIDPHGTVDAGPSARQMCGQEASGDPLPGVNLARQDALGLAAHPRVLAAARRALERHGVLQADTAARMGLTPPVLALEAALAAFVGCAGAVVCPTGWAAGYGAIRALVRPGDHVVIDARAGAALQDGAAAATDRVHRIAHLSTGAVARCLSRLRETEPQAGLLVVAESLSGQTSEAPDLAALRDLCRRHGARLMVDVTHDLGILGPTGRGMLELQDVRGTIDIVLGQLSTAFAADAGFVASDHPGLAVALRGGRGPLASGAALAPVQAAVALAALDIVQSPEGALRRGRLMDNALLLREGLAAAGLAVAGIPSAVVPVYLGARARARRITAAVLAAGAVVHLDEPPESRPEPAHEECHWRLRPGSDHAPADLARFIAAVRQALSQAQDPAWSPGGSPGGSPRPGGAGR